MQLIALVSGDEGLVAWLNPLLNQAGYHLLWCGAYLAAHEIVRAQQPDLVLLELRPERLDSALLVLNRLRLDPATQRCPLGLLATGSVDAEALAALRAAKYQILALPSTPQDVLELLSAALPPLERAVGS